MNSPDNMECPCLCDCGEWFDLNDGFSSKTSNKVVCEKCGEKEEKIEELEDELVDAQNRLSDAEYEASEIPTYKGEVERIQKLIDDLKNA